MRFGIHNLDATTLGLLAREAHDRGCHETKAALLRRQKELLNGKP